jgi:hypothetical protein
MTRPSAVARLFAVLIAVTAVYRLTLLDRGATAFVDETLYFTSVAALQSLTAGDVHGAVKAVATARGRHGATLVQLPVAVLQAIPAHFGIPASNLQSLLIPAICNVLVTLATLYFFFHICVEVCGDAWAALIGTAVYALLVNTNLYVRHMLPYDWALCVGLGAVWLAVTRPRTARLPVWTGLLTGAMVTIYTGYYLFAAVLGVAFVLQAWWSGGWRQAVRFAGLFAAAAATVIAAMEVIFRSGGLSFVGGLLAQSRDIVFLSADDGWMFLPGYLLQVERLSGVALLAGMVAFLWRAALRARRLALRPIDFLILPAVAGWAWQSLSSAQLHTIPLYGRLLHPWMPFLALALADSMAAAERPRLRDVSRAVVVMAGVVSWVLSARAYHRLAYPPDVLYALRIDTTRVPENHKLCELYPGTSYASPGPLDRETRYPYTDAGNNDILVNFCQALPQVPRPIVPAVINEPTTLLYDGPHWMTFPAYAFEGLAPPDRAAMMENGYRVRVFRPMPASR